VCESFKLGMSDDHGLTKPADGWMDGWVEGDVYVIVCMCVAMETMGKGKMVAFPICQLIWMQKAKEMGNENGGKTQMYLINFVCDICLFLFVICDHILSIVDCFQIFSNSLD